jgi:hypothetical protein
LNKELDYQSRNKESVSILITNHLGTNVVPTQETSFISYTELPQTVENINYNIGIIDQHCHKIQGKHNTSLVTALL